MLKQTLKKVLNLVKRDRGSGGKIEIQAKVYRAKTGKWEDLGTISKGRVNLNTNVR